jgi:hypothetical protein
LVGNGVLGDFSEIAQTDEVLLVLETGSPMVDVILIDDVPHTVQVLFQDRLFGLLDAPLIRWQSDPHQEAEDRQDDDQLQEGKAGLQGKASTPSQTTATRHRSPLLNRKLPRQPFVDSRTYAVSRAISQQYGVTAVRQ